MKTTCLLSILITSVLLCLFPLLYFTIYRWVDQTICYQRISDKVGVKPDYLSIRNYILTNVRPGMTEDEVHDVLKRFGSLDVHRKEQIWLDMCAHPLNDILIFVQYSIDDKVKTVGIQDD